MKKFGIPLFVDLDIHTLAPQEQQSEALKQSLKDKKRPLVMVLDDRIFKETKFCLVIEQVFDLSDSRSALHDVLGVKC